MELEVIAGIVLNLGLVGWIYYNLGEMRSDLRGVIYRLERMENTFQLKLKKERE